MAVSQPVVDAHARYFDADWQIVPNGVDTEFFRADARTAGPRGCPELLFLGRLDPRNGLDTVLAAMPRYSSAVRALGSPWRATGRSAPCTSGSLDPWAGRSPS